MSRPLELILARQWCALLSTPVLLFDATGTLVFFNEPAEGLLGRTYDETGPMVKPEWQAAFPLEDDHGELIHGRDNPMSVCVRDQVSAQRVVTVRGMDGLRRRITVTVFPVRGLDHDVLGAMAVFDPAAS
ncbi:MAG: hypothetical protein H6741_23420 [Alphaproteobacteria bacterium]|nr:hypothetical protein [Alphaproteobacteria bacterium]MCB9795659.1 hypothetical protein [Alphaproteobacteria bacterium]